MEQVTPGSGSPKLVVRNLELQLLQEDSQSSEG